MQDKVHNLGYNSFNVCISVEIEINNLLPTIHNFIISGHFYWKCGIFNYDNSSSSIWSLIKTRVKKIFFGGLKYSFELMSQLAFLRKGVASVLTSFLVSAYCSKNCKKVQFGKFDLKKDAQLEKTLWSNWWATIHIHIII